MPSIHRQDAVERIEVLSQNLPRAQRAEIVAAPQGMRLGARVGRLADVIVVRAGRIDAHPVRETRLTQLVQQYAVRGGRSTDVACADE